MFRSVIIPIDPAQKEKATRMIDAARQLLDSGGRITLVSVIESVSVYELAELSSELRARYAAEAKEALRQIAADAELRAEVEIHMGHAAMTILDLADQKAADAIVIASHRPGFKDYFLGSTAARVVRHAKCSVMVLR